ncbi:MAG: VWA domain-containing protein [Thioploca sp.]|nr:VWA domain-containing protein [Thioploca sp.]
MNYFKLIWVVGIIALFSNEAVLAFEPYVHEGITREALREVKVDGTPLFEEGYEDVIAKIVSANRRTDQSPTLLDETAHADGNHLGGASERIHRLFEQIMDDLSHNNHYRAVSHSLGTALHTIQDIYAHSNSVDSSIPIDIFGLKDNLDDKGNPKILCESIDPESLPSTWAFPTEGLVSGYYALSPTIICAFPCVATTIFWPKCVTQCSKDSQCWLLPKGACCHQQLNKDTDKDIRNSPNGSFVPGGIKKFESARSEAIIESEKYLNRILAEIESGKYGDKDLLINRLRGDKPPVILVVDTTGSMSKNIEETKKAIRETIQKQGDVLFGLVTYNDEPVKNYGYFLGKKGIEGLENEIEHLEIKGGGDCRENSKPALKAAKKLFDSYSMNMGMKEETMTIGKIILFTDAPPSLLTKLNLGLIGENSFVSVQLGNCSQQDNQRSASSRLASQNPYQLLADQSGGLFFDLSKEPSKISEALSIVWEVDDRNTSSIVNRGINLVANTPLTVEIPIDGTLSKVTFLVTEPVDHPPSTFILRNLDGTEIQSTTVGVTYQQIGSVRSYKLDNPSAGTWQVTLAGEGLTSLRVFGESTLHIIDTKLLSATERQFSLSDEELGPLMGRMAIGSELVLEIDLTVLPQSASLALLRTDGSVISTSELVISGDTVKHIRANVTIPSEPFMISVAGITAEGGKFVRLLPRMLTPQPVKVTALPIAVAKSGTTLPLEVTLKNLINQEATYKMKASNTLNWSATFPESVTIAANTSQQVIINLEVPKDISEQVNSVAISVEDSAIPDINNYTEILVAATHEDTSLAVKLLSFNAQAIQTGTLVEWQSAHEEDLLAYDLWRGIPKVGQECTTHPEDYEAITHLTAEKFIYPLGGTESESPYQFIDNFTAIDNTSYCYGLLGIENNESRWLGVTPRQ